MAKKKTSKRAATRRYVTAMGERGGCDLPEVAARTFDSSVGPERAGLILRHEKKWVNGTILRYHFMGGAGVRGSDRAKQVVRDGFAAWQRLGIGLKFQETDDIDDAEVRIGFRRGDGSWSYIGRDILRVGQTDRTMNFGWDITRPGEIDTAIHEIGHTLGFPHEHQNPNAGIVWDEEAVYDELGGPPNNWDRDKTFRNILRKIDSREVRGTQWDPNSIMHYPFKAPMIRAPEPYASRGINPRPGLSPKDKDLAKEVYPRLQQRDERKLEPFRFVRLSLDAGGQANFAIHPESTRYYRVATFGTADTVMVLFEDVNGELRYVAGDDDSGYDSNAQIRARMYDGRKYVLRLRLYYQHRKGDFGVLMW